MRDSHEPEEAVGAASGDGDRGAEVAALVAALGLGESELIATLHAHGVRAETVPVLEWVPAVDVCWLDGADVAERHALRVQYVADQRSTSAGVALLDRWLTARPPAEFFAAGRRAMAARLARLDPSDRGEVIDRIIAMCEAAGRAAGAAFGVGPLSAAEQERIRQLRRDLEQPD